MAVLFPSMLHCFLHLYAVEGPSFGDHSGESFTSQDRTDSTSMTTGLDNESKKPGTSTNKIKKSSIKRKVKNFNHDSDDAIIEPLLQTENENPVIANNSAKYLEDEPKTDCLYKEDTKTLESPEVPLPVSCAHSDTNNIPPERQPSPSIISETPPVYRHVNINVFTEDVQESPSNSIFVEFDACEALGYDITPLIFTTAKIHADTKKKLMEQLQATPMPTSTNEGNAVNDGISNEDDKKLNILHTSKYDTSKNVGNKSDLKLDPANFNDVSHAKALTSKNISNTSQTKNEQNLKKKLNDQHPFEKSSELFSKDQKVSLKKSINNTVEPSLPTAKVTSDDTVTTPSKPIIAAATCKANGVFMSDSSKQVIGTEPKSTILDNNNIIDKSKGISNNDKINLNKLSQPWPSSSKQNNKSNTNTGHSDKTDSNKTFSTSSKKLQRQKNASIEEIKEINYKELNNFTTGKNSPLLDKALCTPPDLKSGNATISKPSSPITTVTTKGSTPITSSGSQSTSLISPVTNLSTCKASATTDTSGLISSNAVTETVKTKPAPTRIPEPSRNVIPVTSSKPSVTSTPKSTKVTDDRSSAKQDFKSVSVLPSKTKKTESTTTSSTASHLPLYIVSTSKTKIGSSSTPTISTVTKKSLDQKPTEVANANGKSGKLLMSTSSSQTNQSSSKPKATATANVNVVKKDDRA